jgi:hypothetical protein
MSAIDGVSQFCSNFWLSVTDADCSPSQFAAIVG